jgi:hypothetical protein
MSAIHHARRPLLGLAVATLLAGCAAMGQQGTMRPETVYAVSSSNTLVMFNAGQPGSITSTRRIAGLQAGENVLGIDFRPANGKLYAVGSSGQLYTLDTGTGAATPVGSGGFASFLVGEVGFDFNPVVDRIRVVNSQGGNLRLHPDTGAVVDADANAPGVQTDGRLVYAATDANAGKTASVVGAAYTNSVAGTKTTTNFAIDAAQGTLVTQGTREGAASPVSPNTGQLFTVGALGVKTSGPVGFDIAPNGGIAFAAIGSTFYSIDLANCAAKRLGTIGIAEPVRAIAVAP